MDDADSKYLNDVLDDLIEDIVIFKGDKEFEGQDLVDLITTLDYAKFIVSGIIYKNGICVCGECEDDQ